MKKKEEKSRRSLEPQSREDEEIRFIHQRFLSRLPLFPLIIPLRVIASPPLPSSLLNWLLPFRKAMPIAPAGRFHCDGPIIRRRISAKNSESASRFSNNMFSHVLRTIIDNPLRHRVVSTTLTMRSLPFN